MMRWLTVLALTAFLAAADVEVALVADPVQVAVGDPVRLTVTYRWPRGWQAQPDPGADLRGWFTTAAPPPKSADRGGSQVREFAFTILAERSGEVALPRFTFAARPEAGREPVTAQAPEVVLRVGAAPVDEALPAARPAWVLPPVEEHRLPWWAWTGIAVGLASTIAAVLWWLLRRRRAAAAETTDDRFRRELSASREVTDAKERAAALSLAVRRLAGSVAGFDGPGATARETVERFAARFDAGRLSAFFTGLEALRWAAERAESGALDHLTREAESWAAPVLERIAQERAEAAKRRKPA